MTPYGQTVTIPICSLISKRIKRLPAPPKKVVFKPEEVVLASELCETSPFGAINLSKRVVLVRHGQSTWNEEGRIQGSSDFSVLTRKGESQAETSRQMLSDDYFDVCFSSPLLRSKKTAEIIWGSREDDIVTDWDLREIDLYSFQGLLKNEGKSKFGEAYRQWQVDPANFVIDAHYPVRELWDRARNCWRNILSHKSRSVLVVAHNAVNQALVATAIGLGTDFFRVLLQSNCGVSVLDFTPGSELSPPLICLNRLNQTPSSPVSSVSGAGRKANRRIILACHGTLRTDSEGNGNTPMNMLGVIQSQKTAELLLDVKVSVIVHSPEVASQETAMAVSQVQEAAECLGADCVPRYVEIKESEMVGGISCEAEEMNGAVWDQSADAWNCLIGELSEETSDGRTMVVVASPAVQRSLICRCLGLMKGHLRSFHLDNGSISVIDFPDGPSGRGTVRCLNYTAHLGRWSIPITKPTSNDEDF